MSEDWNEVEARGRHRLYQHCDTCDGRCVYCGGKEPWPCDAARFAELLDREREKVQRAEHPCCHRERELDALTARAAKAESGLAELRRLARAFLDGIADPSVSEDAYGFRKRALRECPERGKA